MKTVNYNQYLSRVASLIGVSSDDLQPAETAILNEYFNHAIKSGWESNYWLDLVNKGEARFVGNLTPYANYYLPPSTWITNNGTVTNAAFPNPIDGRMTAGKFFESLATTTHFLYADNAVPVLPLTSYTQQVYLRPNGRNQVMMEPAIPGSTYSAVFTLTGAGSVSAVTNCTASIGAIANGFYLCSITFTTPNSTDLVWGCPVLTGYSGGTTVIFGGGSFYFWGFWFGPNVSFSNNQLLAWDQTGETEIEALYAIWRSPPSAVRYPAAIPYRLTTNGALLVGSGSVSPSSIAPNASNPNLVYIDYRTRVPNYSGGTWATLSAYAIGDQVYFTTSSGASNFYRALNVTVAGQSPATSPALWQLLAIPAFLFDYVTFSAYAQWLRVEGRNGAAELMENRAQGELDQESDRQERQMGEVQPTKYQTHVSVQPR